MRTKLAIATMLALAGCVSPVKYEAPALPSAKESNRLTVSRPRAEVWKTAIPAIAQRFFVINNIDQSSGLINVSYGGDPERYVDCGVITVEDPIRGIIKFPAAKEQQRFSYGAGLVLLNVNRTMKLEGRVNLIFEERGSSTLITANTRYVLTRDMDATHQDGRSFGKTSTVAFNSGQSGTFSAQTSDGQPFICHPTGRLEADLLEAASR